MTKPAALVAIGIFLSRIAGLIRQRVFAHYFGLESDPADAWSAGFRIPNLLQNLFGEGALSASFIPVYAPLVSSGRQEQADRVAGAVASLLALVVAVLVLIGVAAAPWITTLIAPGFHGAKRDLTIHVVRLLFPGAGLLVLSAWCLGVLNSHHRFLLSYVAPIVWSGAMIATLLAFGSTTALPRLVILLAWGSIAGSALQFVVQLPVVLSVAPGLRPSWAMGNDHVRIVISNFIPVLISRGVVQVSAYVDTLLATLLPTGAVTGLLNAQLLYTLPVSLFGMSVSAAELPTMAQTAGESDALRGRLNRGLRQIAFFVVPSAVAFLALGDTVAAAVLQTGRFRREDSVRVWGILAGASVGLLATTLGRLYSSTYYALRDTRTPLRFAVLRVALTTVLGYLFAIPLPRWLGIDPLWGTAGLTASAGIAGWVEMLGLRSRLNARIGGTGLPVSFVAKLWSAAIAAAAVAWAVRLTFFPPDPILDAIVVLGPYGVVYFGLTTALGVEESAAALRRVTRLR